MNYIESKDNKKIKLISKLYKRKYREEMGVSVVEGFRVIKQVMELGFEIVDLFISESKEKDFDIDKTNVNIVKDNIFNIISDTVNSQGILAIVKNKTWDINEILKNSKRILVLDKVQDPGNIGTIFRTATAVSYDALLYTKGSADIYSAKVNRSAMGVNLNIPSFEVDVKDLQKAKDMGYKILSTILDKDAKEYTKIDYNKKFLLVLGNEANGISDEIVDISDEKVYIPIASGIESLNVSIAGAVVMFKSVESD